MFRVIIAFILGLLDGMFIHATFDGSKKDGAFGYGLFVIVGVNAFIALILIAID